MKKGLIIFAMLGLLTAGQGLAASTSASYINKLEIYDSGFTNAVSASYKILYKGRDYQLANISKTNFTIGLGFLKCAYIPTTVILSPIVTAITPSSGNNTGIINITNLTGANFVAGATVKLSKAGQPDILATNVSVESSGKITCLFDLTGKASGLWDVVATNPDGRSGQLPSGFSIGLPTPTVTSITPNSGVNTSVVYITRLTGTGFRAGAKVKLTMLGESDILADNIVVVSGNTITCRFDLSGKSVGLWDVVVTNDDGQAGTLLRGFKIEAPTIQIVGPVQGPTTPFVPGVSPASIKYTLSKDTDITVNIFNIRGERIWYRAYYANQAGGTAGNNEILWDGVTDFRSVASFGVYIVTLTVIEDGKLKEIGRTKIAVLK